VRSLSDALERVAEREGSDDYERGTWRAWRVAEYEL